MTDYKVFLWWNRLSEEEKNKYIAFLYENPINIDINEVFA